MLGPERKVFASRSAPPSDHPNAPRRRCFPRDRRSTSPTTKGGCKPGNGAQQGGFAHPVRSAQNQGLRPAFQGESSAPPAREFRRARRPDRSTRQTHAFTLTPIPPWSCKSGETQACGHLWRRGAWPRGREKMRFFRQNSAPEFFTGPDVSARSDRQKRRGDAAAFADQHVIGATGRDRLPSARCRSPPRPAPRARGPLGYGPHLRRRCPQSIDIDLGSARATSACVHLR